MLDVIYLEEPGLKQRTASALTVATVAAMEGIAMEKQTGYAKKSSLKIVASSQPASAEAIL